MDLERGGLVAQVEARLEGMLSRDELHPDGYLPAEHLMARRLGVCRGTVREALRRLAARGLVVQRPGRRTRAVVLDETLTLENLSLVLRGKPTAAPERWRLLEGFFALKRELTVELLALCCEQADPSELRRLGSACYALRDEARWDEVGTRWARQEFTLLRLAAQVADRPGHLLLVHSLERSFWAMARWVLPLLDPRAVQEWAMSAMQAVDERNARGLRSVLPALLQACEVPLWASFQPNHREANTPKAPSWPPAEPHEDEASTSKDPGKPPPQAQAADDEESMSESAEEVLPQAQAADDEESMSESAGESSAQAQVADDEESKSRGFGEVHPWAQVSENLSDSRTDSSSAPPTEPPSVVVSSGNDQESASALDGSYSPSDTLGAVATLRADPYASGSTPLGEP